MNSILRYAAIALVAFGGGFFVNRLVSPAPESEFDPASLVSTRVEGDEVLLTPRAAGLVLVVGDGDPPTAAGEVAVGKKPDVVVGWRFGAVGENAVPCVPPNPAPICTPLDPPPDTLTLCIGGKDDSLEFCFKYDSPEPVPLPEASLPDLGG